MIYMASAGDDKQKINSEDKLPRNKNTYAKYLWKGLIILIIFTNTGLLNIMPLLAYNYPLFEHFCMIKTNNLKIKKIGLFYTPKIRGIS
jgi:hypothetical protein